MQQVELQRTSDMLEADDEICIELNKIKHYNKYNQNCEHNKINIICYSCQNVPKVDSIDLFRSVRDLPLRSEEGNPGQ